MKRAGLLLCVCFLAAGSILSCGKSSEQKAGGAAADSVTAVPSLVGAELAAKGFVVVQEREAPSQRSSRSAKTVVYRSRDKKSGGVVYVSRALVGTVERVGWHWYFEDAAPDSAALMELNHDGLWDVRIYLKSGPVDFIQGESFSLLGRVHEGTEVMNGSASAPAELWKCFDGDSTTVWQSPASGAFIEIPIPLGLETAELEVQVPRENPPLRINVFADGNKLQTIDLSETVDRQMFRLDPAAQSAALIRIELQGNGDVVAISELEIR
jgi:hypothetical protein